MLFRDRQHALRRSQQIGDGGTAADFVGIHHVTNTRSVQGITSLQQVDPAFVQFRLLLADRLQDGKFSLSLFSEEKKSPPEINCKAPNSTNTSNRLVTTFIRFNMISLVEARADRL